ncbi:hypothetical protein [Clostridium sp. BJN0013]|uniref:hypothetical protein n=1 Tax=Clostridium sp. BJN0013 TaxID=3236840 RepID=UPI0034C65378
MTERNDNQEQLSVDEQAKQQFLEELKNKNMEEKRKLEEFKNQQEKNQSGDELENIDEDDIADGDREKEDAGEQVNEIEDIGSDGEVEPEKKGESEHDVVDVEKDELKHNLEHMDKNDESNTENEAKEDENENSVVELENKVQKEDQKVSHSKFKVAFLPKILKASIIDTAITSIVSLAVLYLFDVILRLMGYQVADMKGMYILIFIIVLILYPSIMSKFKYKQTIGQKFS